SLFQCLHDRIFKERTYQKEYRRMHSAIVVSSVVAFSVVACKAVKSDSAVKDVNLLSNVENTRYIAYEENGHVHVTQCPKDAVPGEVIREILIPQECADMKTEAFNRLNCVKPTEARPVPFKDYQDRLR